MHKPPYKCFVITGVPMPEASSQGQTKSMTCSSSIPGPPTTTPMPSNTAELVAFIASSGPVENATEAKAYLKQHALIAVNGNYMTNSLANILFTTVIENKIPNNAMSIIKAVSFLLLQNWLDYIIEGLQAAIVDKLSPITQSLTNNIDWECSFIKVTTSE